jgi:hypothetical protein
MKKIVKFLSLATMIISSTHAYAQQVGTIGLGDITYSAVNGANSGARKGTIVLNELNSGLVDALTKTRKFAVMDHPKLLARLKKQNRNLRGYYFKQYSGNALWQEGLDFILKANVTEFSLGKQTQENGELGLGKIGIDFQLYGVADVTYDLKSSVSVQFVMPIETVDQKTRRILLNKTVRKSVDHVVDEIVSSLFPIQIVKITEEGIVTLNYGDGFLDVGDSVLIYPLENEFIIDEEGKAAGNAVATLRVNSTAQKFSISQMPEDLVLEKGQKGRLVLTKR